MATLGHAVTFMMGNQPYAISLEYIKSIEPFDLIETQEPGSSVILGKSIIRDEEVIVLDLQSFLLDHPFQQTEESRLLYVEAENERFAIAVSAGEVINGHDLKLKEMGLAGNQDNQFVTNVVLLNDQIIPVINPQILFGTFHQIVR
ncbi:chemotaxis signal transduction protein [Bacillus oleivorans]|uniref:Chemotaxis signal transduction protein n=1 Tax=Bacillus oleivorans TaxID=1448271 RepID=A0A285CKW7_9BACI|nr:chemotaxis protein CheW [Bacillus oleivorans]SNX68015.1 chemotaxis signal transduction protein [Bacillus oleivorans]